MYEWLTVKKATIGKEGKRRGGEEREREKRREKEG
jgi:hypothetical protein